MRATRVLQCLHRDARICNCAACLSPAGVPRTPPRRRREELQQAVEAARAQLAELQAANAEAEAEARQQHRRGELDVLVAIAEYDKELAARTAAAREEQAAVDALAEQVAVRPHMLQHCGGSAERQMSLLSGRDIVVVAHRRAFEPFQKRLTLSYGRLCLGLRDACWRAPPRSRALHTVLGAQSPASACLRQRH